MSSKWAHKGPRYECRHRLLFKQIVFMFHQSDFLLKFRDLTGEFILFIYLACVEWKKVVSKTQFRNGATGPILIRNICEYSKLVGFSVCDTQYIN